MEQNNYAVGEQRERDTKGWSDSEANKLRSNCVLQVALGLSGKARTGGSTSPISPTRLHRIAGRGLANELETTVPRFNGMFEINIIAGCVFALESLWYAGERQLPNKISEKREISAHTRPLSTWHLNWFPMVGTLGQQYNDLVARLLPIYREGSVVAGDAVRQSNYTDVEFPVKVS